MSTDSLPSLIMGAHYLVNSLKRVFEKCMCVHVLCVLYMLLYSSPGEHDVINSIWHFTFNVQGLQTKINCVAAICTVHLCFNRTCSLLNKDILFFLKETHTVDGPFKKRV